MLLYFCLFVFLNVLCRPISKCSQLTTLVTAECVRTLHVCGGDTAELHEHLPFNSTFLQTYPSSEAAHYVMQHICQDNSP